MISHEKKSAIFRQNTCSSYDCYEIENDVDTKILVAFSF